jgi:hypothetical protein
MQNKMLRQAALYIPAALRHVMAQGTNRTAIFEDGYDKIRFYGVQGYK